MSDSTDESQTTLADFSYSERSDLRQTVERHSEDIEQLRRLLEDTLEQIDRLAATDNSDESPADTAEDARETPATPSMFQ